MKKFLLIDGHGLAYRGFYALPASMAASDGTPTNAVVGFVNMLLHILDEMKPDGVGIFFDPKGRTKRHAMFPEYKAGRKPTPDEFKVQLPLIREICEALGLPCFVRDETEADDFIYSTAKHLSEFGNTAIILSADKDLFQAIDEHIRVARPKRGVSDFIIYDEPTFHNEYGFSCKYMADYLSLLGDAVDNIPGVKGIGEKAATELCTKYGSLEKIYDHIEEIIGAKRKKLEEGRESAYKSMALIIPQETAPAEPEALAAKEIDMEKLRELTQKLGLKKIAERFSIDLNAPSETQKRAPQETDKANRNLVWDMRRILVEDPDTVFPPDVTDVKISQYMMHPDRTALMSAPANLSSMDIALTPELEKLARDIDYPLARVLAQMQRTGIYCDAERLSSIKAELISSIAETEEEIAQKAGKRINLSSPKQVGTLLFETLGLPPIKKTHSGYSTDISVLEELAAISEVPKLIIEFREQSKMLSGFVEPFLELARENNNIIHSTFDHLATGTGRLASSSPNVQNLPVFGKWAENFRGCFVPRSQNSVFVAADYSQIELRVMADMSGEERLIEAFAENRDIHTETASWVFGLDKEDITPEQRRMAKVINFGLLYGMSAFGLAQKLGITRTAAAGIVSRYFEALPKVKRYFEHVTGEAKARGCTVSKFGRIRPLSELSTTEGRGNNPIARIAANTPIQSTASDIAKTALIRFADTGAAPVILQVHDSIVCECPAEDADRVEHILVDTMESVNILTVPLQAVPKRGKSLAEI